MTLSSLKAASRKDLAVRLFAVLSLTIVQPAAIAADKTPNQPPVMEITVFSDLISVELVDAPLTDVFKVIEKKTGSKVHLIGIIDEPVTMSLTNEPLDKGLKRLAGKHSLSLLYSRTPANTGQDTTKNITEIWLYSRQTSNATAAEAIGARGVTVPVTQKDGAGTRPNTQRTYTVTAQQTLPINRQPSIQELVQRADSTAVMALAGYLGHEDKDVRRQVVAGIGSIQGEGSTKVLGQVLRAETDPEIRMIAVRALAARQDDMYAHTLLTEALTDPDQDVQILASQLLGRQ